MSNATPPPHHPLHGNTLQIDPQAILEHLLAREGRERLGERINIHCLRYPPSVNSSWKFLRNADRARGQVERLSVNAVSDDPRKGKKRANVQHQLATAAPSGNRTAGRNRTASRNRAGPRAPRPTGRKGACGNEG